MTFDTADMYSHGVSEEITGRLLEQLPRRDDYVLATENLFPDGLRDRTTAACRASTSCPASMPRCGDWDHHVDLYQIHRWDYETPIEEVMEALHDVVLRQGALHRRVQHVRLAVRQGPARRGTRLGRSSCRCRTTTT